MKNRGDCQFFFFLVGNSQGGIGRLQVLQQVLCPPGFLGRPVLEQNKNKHKNYSCQKFRDCLDQPIIRFEINFEYPLGDAQDDRGV
jgi:hypothetical protein